VLHGIEEILARQERALLLLKDLLEEEFSLLAERKPQSVSQIELSIQELLRQIANERACLKRAVKAVKPVAERVRELYDGLVSEDRQRIEGRLQGLDRLEQRCAVQASKNQELAFGLFDQSRSLLEFLHNEIRPKNSNAYSAKGRLAQSENQALFLRGRL
jgi:flagellar biosynthesis/type III secretory pathway chaperone